MGRLKPNRKPAFSSQSIDPAQRQRFQKIAMIIAENWDEIWKIVCRRATTGIYPKQTTQIEDRSPTR